MLVRSEEEEEEDRVRQSAGRDQVAGRGIAVQAVARARDLEEDARVTRCVAQPTRAEAGALD